MEKNEILKAAQQEKNKGNEFENKMSVKGSLFGALIALFVGTIIFILEFTIKKTINYGLIAVALTAAGTQLLFEGIKIKKTQLIVCGAIELIIALFALITVIAQLVME